MKLLYTSPLMLAMGALVSLAAPTPVLAQNQDLATKTENTLGMSLVKYRYDEPGLMRLDANKLALSYSGTYVLGNSWPDPGATWFVRAEADYAVGPADYQSQDTRLSNTPHSYTVLRGLVGKDFAMGGYVLAPYVGLGHRRLTNNLGYQRDSTYTTLPVGVAHKFKLADQSVLVSSVEYMHLLQGRQNVTLPLQSVSLAQKKGFGLRLSMMRRDKAWSMGPTLTYWNLGASEVGGAIPVFEPQNKTLELGLKGAYSF